MRAKLQVTKAAVFGDSPKTISVEMAPVCEQPFGPNGESEDNTFARWTPSGSLSLVITNPDLVDKIKEGQRFYVDFTEVSPPSEQVSEAPPTASA